MGSSGASLLIAVALLGSIAGCGADDSIFGAPGSSATSGAGAGDAAGDDGSGAIGIDGSGVGASGNGAGASGVGASGAASGAGAAPEGSGPAGAGSGGGSSGCAAQGLAPGDHAQTIQFGGMSRTYLLHVPTNYGPSDKTPLVLNFHGFTSNAADQAAFSAMSPVADAESFVVAYPAGIDSSWNAGQCCGTAAVTLLDDVGFARAIVEDISAKLCIDSKRVYSTGMSNGGYLSHRNGCESADIFAAIAPVAGVLGIPPADCQPSRPIPVIHFHGTTDILVPYAGGGVLGSPSAPDTDAGWAARNGCTGAPVSTYSKGAAHCETHQDCDGGVQVTLCTVEGEGHCWPGQSYCPLGASSVDIDANQEMWKFFSQYALP